MNGTKDIQLIKSTLCVFIFILRILNETRTSKICGIYYVDNTATGPFGVMPKTYESSNS